MKVETSITLPNDLLLTVDKLSQSYQDRSEFIEVALRAYIAHLFIQEPQHKDLALINANAEQLNTEAMDVLEYQIIP